VEAIPAADTEAAAGTAGAGKIPAEPTGPAIGTLMETVGMILHGIRAVGMKVGMILHGIRAVGMKVGMILHGIRAVGMKVGMILHGIRAVGMNNIFRSYIIQLNEKPPAYVGGFSI